MAISRAFETFMLRSRHHKSDKNEWTHGKNKKYLALHNPNVDNNAKSLGEITD